MLLVCGNWPLVVATALKAGNRGAESMGYGVDWPGGDKVGLGYTGRLGRLRRRRVSADGDDVAAVIALMQRVAMPRRRNLRCYKS